ncbi:MAG: DUF3472 domain-containing protein [Pirellulaceae bacterium]|jgi:hypothetical protein|nr:DUF3472 domain-containing protein [Pirellulaceae bacterium]MDP7017520.1 DUF3472 domain-containing protein [Pirellulaceae bacterium]
MNRSVATALVLLLSVASFARGQNSAPSSHMVFDDKFAGDIIVNEVRVPRSGHAMYTYYEALGWRGKGAGYAGIQVHPRAHNFIFSIWDNKSHTAPIRAVHRGPGTETQKFGGEGTGLKSWNFELGWKTDVWYTLVARSWSVDKSTHFAFWSRAGDTKQWTHLVTMAVALPDAKFEGATDAFIEDWLNTGAKLRTTHLRNGWKRSLDGKWKAFEAGRYSVNYWDLDKGKRSYNYRTAWNGGVTRDDGGPFYFMTAGGKETKPTTENPSRHELARKEKEPAFRPLRIATATGVPKEGQVLVSWTVDPTAAPQFAYEIAAFKDESSRAALASARASAPHIREATLKIDSIPPNHIIRIRCRDIFDRQSPWRTVKLSK